MQIFCLDNASNLGHNIFVIYKSSTTYIVTGSKREVISSVNNFVYELWNLLRLKHCVKNVRIRSYVGLHFTAKAVKTYTRANIKVLPVFASFCWIFAKYFVHL